MTRHFSNAPLPPELEAEVDACCDQYEAAWQAGSPPSLEEYLKRASEAAYPHLFRELLALERHYRRDAEGRPLDPATLAQCHPALAAELANLTARGSTESTTRRPSGASEAPSDVQLASDDSSPPAHPSRGLHVRCPHCSNPMEILADTPYDDVTCRTCGSTFNLVQPDGPTGSLATLRRIGRFELVARLGVGGFGTVWKARDTELDRLVAVKLPRKGQLSADETEQFFREARAAAQLRHRHIVAVYEVGREDDVVYIVSDYIRGVSLADWLTGARAPFEEVARIGETIARALEHAHQQGVIHRDLKPSNIMISEQQEPLIMDFGLAKRTVGEITMTVEGQILGTPAYMSPEQARGHSHWTDQRTDIYSLGVVLYRLLTGELPFRGNARMQLHNKLTSDAPDPRKLNHAIPRDLSTICLKCIERDPNHRYPSALEVAEELRRYRDGEPIRARPISATARAWRWARRRPAVAAALGLAFLLAVLGPWTAWQQRQLYQRELLLRQAEQTRLAEREGLIRDQKERLDEEAAQTESLRETLARIQSVAAKYDIEATGWRIELMESLLAAREKAMRDILTDPASDHQAMLHAGLGLALLQTALDRSTEASETLRTIDARFASAGLGGTPGQTSDRLADQAEVLEWLAELEQKQGNDDAARTAWQRAIALRRRLADLDSLQLDSKIRLLADTLAQAAWATPDDQRLGTLSQAPPIVAEIKQQWPESPARFYELARELIGQSPSD